jgi:4-hydroxy-3-polyprenylbenzoate decarboxylase
MKSPKNIVVAVTGASGAVYSLRLIEVLLATGYDVHLSITPTGAQVIHEEMDLRVDLNDFQPADMMLDDVTNASDSKIRLLQASAGIGTADSNVLSVEAGRVGELHYHHYRNFNAPIASGSFLTGGMVVTPCSGSTLSAVAHASSENLIHRAAEVHLKERRKLILVPRETPLSLPHIDNMRRCTEAGAVVLPAAPGWYHGVSTLRDLVDFIVARVCDQLGIDNALIARWGADA